jgi:hypothetical protein
MKVVVVQPLFFPWSGAFEKILLADIYVHFDDVPFSKGSFTNRVQIKTSNGPKWLTVPLRELHLGQKINEVTIDNRQDWRKRHLSILTQAYRNAPYRQEMINLVSAVYATDWTTISDLTIASIEVVSSFFDINPPNGFIRSSSLAINGQKSERVQNVVTALQGTTYICGMGRQSIQQRYLDHGAFEAQGIRVEYIVYQKIPYRQLHGSFNPYMSVLDLIANEGWRGKSLMVSRSVYWKSLLDTSSSL